MKRVEIHNASGSGTSTMTNEELPKIVLESIRIEFPTTTMAPKLIIELLELPHTQRGATRR